VAIVVGGVIEKRSAKQNAASNCQSALTRFASLRERAAPEPSAEEVQRLSTQLDKGIADCRTAGMTDAGAALEGARTQVVRPHNVAECNRLVTMFKSVAAKEMVLGIEEGIANADEGVRTCELAGMKNEADMMRDVKKASEQQRANAPPVDPASCPRGQRVRDTATGKLVDCTGAPDDSKGARTAAAALDPATCPKGRRLIDPATGSMVTCTGGAAGTPAGSDDYGDLQARCNSVNALWDRSDGIEPIVTCSGGGPNHQDIEVEVSGAAWTFLGERGKRRAFAKSLVDAYRPHWKTFHGWSGADPAEKQVHIMKISGASITLAALTSAGGLYTE